MHVVATMQAGWMGMCEFAGLRAEGWKIPLYWLAASCLYLRDTDNSHIDDSDLSIVDGKCDKPSLSWDTNIDFTCKYNILTLFLYNTNKKDVKIMFSVA